MVEAGLTVAFPEGGRAPLPGTMVTDETPVAFQFSNELPPALILEGLAVKERITGEVNGGEAGGSEAGGSEVGGSEAGGSEVGGSEAGGSEAGGSEVGGDGAVTAIVTDWVTLPAALLAVMV